MEEIPLQHFPLHIRRVPMLNEHKKDIDDVPSYIKRLSLMYDEARLANTTKNIFILHQAMQEVPEIECHKKGLDSISKHLSNLRLEDDAGLTHCIADIRKIEADRRT